MGSYWMGQVLSNFPSLAQPFVDYLFSGEIFYLWAIPLGLIVFAYFCGLLLNWLTDGRV